MMAKSVDANMISAAKLRNTREREARNFKNILGESFVNQTTFQTSSKLVAKLVSRESN